MEVIISESEENIGVSLYTQQPLNSQPPNCKSTGACMAHNIKTLAATAICAVLIFKL